MWGTGPGTGGWTMIVLLAVTVLVVAVLGIGAVWSVRTPRGTPLSADAVSANAILDARFARGEITEAELMQCRQALGKNAAGSGGQN